MKKYKLSEILNDGIAFERCLFHSLILFPKESKYYNYSGYVTAALLNLFKDDTILAINTGHLQGWITLHLSMEELVEFLNHRPEISPENAESESDCYFLE